VMMPVLIIGAIVACSAPRACSATSPKRSPPRRRPRPGPIGPQSCGGAVTSGLALAAAAAVLGPAQVRLTPAAARADAHPDRGGGPVAQRPAVLELHEALRQGPGDRTALPRRRFHTEFFNPPGRARIRDPR